RAPAWLVPAAPRRDRPAPAGARGRPRGRRPGLPRQPRRRREGLCPARGRAPAVSRDGGPGAGLPGAATAAGGTAAGTVPAHGPRGAAGRPRGRAGRRGRAHGRGPGVRRWAGAPRPWLRPAALLAHDGDGDPAPARGLSRPAQISRVGGTGSDRDRVSARSAMISTPPSTITPPTQSCGPGWSPQTTIPRITASTGVSSSQGVSWAISCRWTSTSYRPWPSSEENTAEYSTPAQPTQLAPGNAARAPGSNNRLSATSGPTAMIELQPCWLTVFSPARRRISTGPSARKPAETSISNNDAGCCMAVGSKPITSTPVKLTAIAAPVRQPKRSPSTAQASSEAIGT